MDLLDQIEADAELRQPLLPLYHRRQPRDRLNPLNDYDDVQFYSRFRFSKEGSAQIYRLVSPQLIDRPDNRGHPVPGVLILAVTMRFLALGSFQNSIGDHFGLDQSTVSVVIRRGQKTYLMTSASDVCDMRASSSKSTTGPSSVINHPKHQTPVPNLRLKSDLPQ